MTGQPLDRHSNLAAFAAAVALCEWQNGEWPNDEDLTEVRPQAQYVAGAVLAALKDGTARGFEESGF